MQKIKTINKTFSRDSADLLFLQTLVIPRQDWADPTKMARLISIFYKCLTTCKNPKTIIEFFLKILVIDDFRALWEYPVMHSHTHLKWLHRFEISMDAQLKVKNWHDHPLVTEILMLCSLSVLWASPVVLNHTQLKWYNQFAASIDI